MTKPSKWVAFGVIIVIVLAGSLIAARPSIGCRITLGTWVPEHPVERVGVGDTYWPVYYFEPAHCVY